jgi:hypothetical protein
MIILQEILVWSQSLPAWQSDAIARLFIKQKLSTQDIADLYALLKADQGIPDPDGRVAKRLKADQIPSGPSKTSHVELLAIKNLENVNAIAENQRLPFGPKGLTIIYGDNGSGKSGYSRVLKRACRARDQSEPIHPKSNLPPGHSGRAAAVFEVDINGTVADLNWADGAAAPSELSTIAIFDSRCARAYLDDEDDFAYVPYGLDILQGLAQACSQLDTLVRAELSRNIPDPSSFDDLAGKGTTVSNLIGGLSAKTKPERVEALAKLGTKELARRDALEQNLKADDPLAKAAQLRLLANRISKLSQTAEEKFRLVDGQPVARLEALAEAHQQARNAAKLAAQAFQNDSTFLPGTGGEVWKRLFESARSFYRQALPHEISAYTPETPCALCQQSLGEAANRLNQFDKFLQDETEKHAKTCEREFDEATRTFNSLNVNLGFDRELETEIEEKRPGLGSATRDSEVRLDLRHKSISQALESNRWNELTPEPQNPFTQLRDLSLSLLQEASDLETVADQTARTAMENEFKELDARLRLSKVKGAVVTAIEKMGLQAKLTKCLKAVKTNAISNKAKELAASVISTDLAKALNKEFKALSADGLSVSLQSRSAKGKTLHKLKLSSAQSQRPAEVLSEGEQRAIAIGSFLAEVNLSGGMGGVVFDDPVSSLDHKRRERVATRLVQEALKRQVIIFTHEVYFVSILQDEAAKVGAPCLSQSLIRKPEGYGVADPKLPFEVLKTKSRIGELRSMQQKIAKLYKDGNESEHRKQTFDAYRQLRLAWERAVEEVLFRGVVIRFRKGVSTQLLSEVVVEDADYAAVEGGMTKCSNYAHDQALLGGTAIPDPEELLADINALETWRALVDNRSSEIRKRRKTAASAI